MQIYRMGFYFKYSEEYFRWEKLMHSVKYYKGLLGVVELPEEVKKELEKNADIKDAMIDLYPYGEKMSK